MNRKSGENKQGISRRNFIIKSASVVVGIGLVAPSFFGPFKQLVNGTWEEEELHGIGRDDQDYDATNVIHTVCQQCNSNCTIRALMVPGDKKASYTSVVRKIAGNAYSPINTVSYGQKPYNMSPYKVIAGSTTGKMAVEGRGFRGGRTCLKGQAGIQTAYDAYRLKTPLRRSGSRGSGKWESITWEQAYQDIVEGNSQLGTPGLKSIWAYIPEEPVMEDWKKVEEGKLEFAEFDAKYRDVLIDTRHPDAGPKANQIVGFGGDRRDFATRFFNSQVGSVNFYDHSAVCGVSSAIGTVYSHAILENGKRVVKRVAADIDNTEFLIVWGSNPLVASKSPTYLAPKITNALARGMKMAVIEPRMSKTAEKATMWIPIEPGQDAALAMGMARWIIENKRYDEAYLRNCNKVAANQAGEPTWSDATYLINLDAPDKPFLSATDASLGDAESAVVMVDGVPQLAAEAQKGDLEVDTVIGGKRVQSVFTLFKQRVLGKSLQQYADLCKIPVEQIVTVAKEFTSYGKKASIMMYRGPSMHANGYHAVRAINILSHLIGNADWKGGNLFGGAHYNEFTGRYNLNSVPNANKAWGIPLDRHKAKYEQTTYFKRDGYPAKRRWYPVAGAAAYDVLPGAEMNYPYGLKAMFVSRFSPIMSMPNGQIQERLLKDPKVVPLLVVSDIVMSETASVADYILPDLSYLERFGREGIFENLPWKISTVIQPVTRVIPEARSTDDVYIELAKRMKWPGVNDNAFVGGGALNSAMDYYLKRVANIAFDGIPVPDASDEELKLFEKARELALGPFFDINVWKKTVTPEEWRKVVYVLNRGGRFAGNEKAYNGDFLAHQWGEQVNFYADKVAKMKNPLDGSLFDGLPRVEEPSNYKGQPMPAINPLRMIHWKSRNLATHRTISNVWLREIRDENYLWMNSIDAKMRGLRTGDQVRIKGPDYETKGHILVTEMIRPGVVGASYSFGHTQYGSSSYTIDGRVIWPPKPYSWTSFNLNKPMHEELGIAGGRGEGFSINNLLAIDHTIPNSCYADIVGGSPAQYDLYVEVQKV